MNLSGSPWSYCRLSRRSHHLKQLGVCVLVAAEAVVHALGAVTRCETSPQIVMSDISFFHAVKKILPRNETSSAVMDTLKRSSFMRCTCSCFQLVAAMPDTDMANSQSGVTRHGLLVTQLKPLHKHHEFPIETAGAAANRSR